MPQIFTIRIEFLHSRFHGRGEGGEPEWPPSPLRLFQALTAACAGLSNERVEIHQLAEPLRWLEQQAPPTIIAPDARRAEPYRLYVPNNTGDLAASSWASGREKNLASFRTEKDIHPHVITEQHPLHYLWELPEDSPHDPADLLQEAVRAITHLGWGVDQVVADAFWLTAEEASTLPGLRYEPADQPGPRRLPAPVPGTFKALTARHQAALGRLQNQGGAQIFFPVPRLTAMRWVDYAKETDLPPRQVKVFALKPVDPKTTAQYQAYDPVKQTTVVVAMVRALLNQESFARQLGWDAASLAMLHGHGEAKGETTHIPTDGPRLAIVPLPSNEWRGDERGMTIGSTRRLLLTVLKGNDENGLDDVAHLLAGRKLVPDDETTRECLLQPIDPDKTVARYLRLAHTWTTVTPVILPGHDDPGRLRKKLANAKSNLTAAQKNALVETLVDREETLLRKAIVQAGYSETLAKHADISWRGTGFMPGVNLSQDYFVPQHLQRFRKYHVKITWRDAAGIKINMPGPILLGGGRFFGLGLFIPVEEQQVETF